MKTKKSTKDFIKQVNRDIKSARSKMIISATCAEVDQEIIVNSKTYTDVGDDESGVDIAATMAATIIFNLKLRIAKNFGREGLEKVEFMESYMLANGNGLQFS